MGSFEFKCEICGGTIDLAGAGAGGRTVCPHCNGMVLVPRAGSGSTPPPLPARPGVRVCPRCGRTVPVDPQSADRNVRCPGCWTELRPDGSMLIAPDEHETRRNRRAKAAAWASSVLLHSVLFVVFAGVTWFSGFGRGAGGEQEVGVIGENAALDTQSPDAVQLQNETRPPELSEVKEPVDILEVGASQKPETDTIIGIEGGAAASAGSEAFKAFAGGSAGGGTASFFGLSARGSKFVFVVDRSQSMGEFGKLGRAKEELRKSVEGLRGNLQFFIIFYDHGTLPMPSPKLVPANAGNKQKYLTWVESVFPGGWTDPTGAMKQALDFKPDAIWLMSDGLFHDSAADFIRDNNPGKRVRIHTIAFHDNAGEPVLRRIAEENRGDYRFVKPHNRP